jgi:hypothetical protein
LIFRKNQNKELLCLLKVEKKNLVIFGLTKSGSLWTIVRDAGSAGNPFLPYESYKSNKMEDDKWEYKEKGWMSRTNKTMLKMTAIAKLGEHFKTLIWIVEVESKWQDTLL